MTTLVTGATGGLGRNAVEWLASQQQAVRGSGRNLAAGAALQAQGIEFVAADLATAQSEEIDRLLDGVETVWHCAALSSPWGRYEDFYAANVTATTRLAGMAAMRGVRRFIHISTPSIYFDYRHRANIPETFRPARFVNHYAHTKALAEEGIRALAARHPRTTFVMLRPRGIFGPHDRVLLPRILRVLHERNGRLPLPRGGAARLDLTYAGNVVHAMQLATTRADIVSGEAFNITNGEPVMLRETLAALLAALGVDCRIVALPYPVLNFVARAMEARAALTGKEPSFTRYGMGALNYDMTLDIGKAWRVLGYRPVVTMDEGIAATALRMRKHGDAHGF
ncbi:MAG: NAD-dependent epimerase/dehydratase family protein [Methylobacillus sp.]|jgi:nucleoside-diphosphate-sugar epimerase|nr:NAD-dependent epimerase/dehydratase family protein [Methylobacillus sp.]